MEYDPKPLSRQDIDNLRNTLKRRKSLYGLPTDADIFHMLGPNVVDLHQLDPGGVGSVDANFLANTLNLPLEIATQIFHTLGSMTDEEFSLLAKQQFSPDYPIALRGGVTIKPAHLRKINQGAHHGHHIIDLQPRERIVQVGVTSRGVLTEYPVALGDLATIIFLANQGYLGQDPDFSLTRTHHKATRPAKVRK